MSFDISTAVGDYEGEAIFCGEQLHTLHLGLERFYMSV